MSVKQALNRKWCIKGSSIYVESCIEFPQFHWNLQLSVINFGHKGKFNPHFHWRDMQVFQSKTCDRLQWFCSVTWCLFCFCCLTEGLWCRRCCGTVISCCCGYWFWHNIQWLRLQLHQGARMYSCNEVRAAMQHLVCDSDTMGCLQ